MTQPWGYPPPEAVAGAASRRPMALPLRRGRLQQEGDQVAEAAPFMISTLLQALVELPAHGGCDPLRFAAEQIHSGSRG